MANDVCVTTPAKETIQPVYQEIDLARICSTPWAYVDERVCAAIQSRSVKSVQRDRQLKIGAPYRKINGKCVRYRISDVLRFLESQPGGGSGEVRKPVRGRPRKVA